MRDPAVGIDYSRIVVGEFTLRLHAPIPAAGTVRGEHRILRITDKGEGRGALVTVLRELWDAAGDALLAEYEQVTFCRGDGGFAVDGRHDAPRPLPQMPLGERAADLVIALPTSPRQALIYRLSGDMNPLHSHPAVAKAAGFERPILHGLSTMGMAGHALARAMSNEGLELAQLSARFAAPVFPGDLLSLQAWRANESLAFCVTNATGREVVSNGHATFRQAAAAQFRDLTRT
jgi:acyl dehydratase